MKCLVTNADDFGFDPAINAAVVQAHTTGILTSASLMIGAPHAESAVELARAHPALGVGIHLCLVDAQPVSAPSAIAALTDIAGALPQNAFALVMKLTANPPALTAAELELRAQVEKFMATGLRPTHLDTHQHTHLHPGVMEIVVRLAKEYRIRWVRSPLEPLARSLRSDAQHPVRTLARWPIFQALGARCQQQLRQRDLETCTTALGVLNAGQLSEEFLLAAIPRIEESATEIVCHPATESNDRLRRYQPGYRHADELRALCSLRVKAQLEQLGIRLVNFRQLADRLP